MQHLHKTGGGGYSSHSGKPCPVIATRTRFSFKFFLFTFLRTLLRFFAFMQNSTLSYTSDSALFTKSTPGGGCPAAEAPIAGRRKDRSTSLNLFAAKRLYF